MTATSRSNDRDAAPGTMLGAALDLANHGFRVFPLAVRGKKPLIPKRAGGNGCLDATNDPEMIQAWWRGSPHANVGVATGDGLLVVDVDGEEAAFAFTDLINESGMPWPIRTPTVLTGKGGLRMHYYLATPSGVVLANTAGKVCKGVDTRADGGYGVAPPSIHPDSGQPYNWVVSPAEEPLAAAPEWLIELLLRDADEPLGAHAPFKAARATAPLGARILGEECARISTAPEGERNHTAFARCAAIGNLVAGGLILLAEATERLTHAAEHAGLGAAEAEAVVVNGLTRGLATPRLVGDGR